MEAGAVRIHGTHHIFAKNLLDLLLGSIVWYATGYGLASASTDSNRIAGNTPANFALSGTLDATTAIDWVYGWAFATSSATIVSGAVAERCRLGAYAAVSVLLTGLIYPINYHLVFHGFYPDVGRPVIDVAGSGYVHMVGGVAGLVGAVLLGPRRGRDFSTGVTWRGARSNSVAYTMLGLFILWVGWFFFTASSVVHGGGDGAGAFVAAINIVLASSFGACAMLATEIPVMLSHKRTARIVETVCDGALAGLVGVTACAHSVEPHGAIATGVAAAGACYLGAHALVWWGIDDPLNAFPIHGCGGAAGLLMAGLLSTKTLANEHDIGLLYHGDATQLGVQVRRG